MLSIKENGSHHAIAFLALYPKLVPVFGYFPLHAPSAYFNKTYILCLNDVVNLQNADTIYILK